MALRTLTESQWKSHLISIGIPSGSATEYAVKLCEQQIPKSLLKDLSDEELREDFGVKLKGHRLIIRNSCKTHSSVPDVTGTLHNNKIQHKAPQLSPSMNPRLFRAFIRHWEVYKRLVGIPEEFVDTAAQIFSLCCNDHPDIRHTIADYDPDHLSMSEHDYFELLRKLLTSQSTPEIYRDKFFNMVQQENETCHQWLKRLKAVILDCEFTISCDKEEGHTHKFDDMLIRTKFILGTHNVHIKQDLLTKSPELKTLDEVFSHASRMETTSRDMNLSHKTVASIGIDSPNSSSSSCEDEEICKVSTYKKSKKPPRKPTPSQMQRYQSPQTSPKPCNGCGSHKHTTSNRSTKCPAWNKVCNNCGKRGHFGKVCNGERTDHADAVIAEVANTSTSKDEIEVKVTPQVGSKKTLQLSMYPDTGATLCVAGLPILRSLGIKLSQLKHSSRRMKTATGDKINCRGWFPAQLTLNNKSTRQNIYICDNIQRIYLSKEGCLALGIIHKDFPSPINTNVNNKDESKPAALSASTKRPDKIPFDPTPENIALLKDYLLRVFSETVFNNDKSRYFPKMLGVPKADIHLSPNATPYFRATPNQLPYYWREATKELLDEFVRRGMIAKKPIGTPTPWCHPMVITAKKSNTSRPKIRMTVDLTHLNSQCIRELHHVESPFKLVSQIPKNTYKTVLDAVDGYQAIELDEKSQHLTTFITHWGAYYFLRIPAGLIDSGDKYTSRYDFVIQHIPRKVKCVDDTLLYDFTIEDAFYHTFDYLSTCEAHGIVLNASKFQFCEKELTFAGFTITPTSIKPSDSTLKAIREFPIPQNITDVRSWFGLVRQVAYAYSISEHLAPFRDLLKHSNGEKPKFIWNDQLQEVFNKSKEQLVESVVNGIKMFEPSRHTCLQCDWSKHGVGFLLLQKHCNCEFDDSSTVVQQCCTDGWKLVYAGSRFTIDAESRYAPTEGEALAVSWALKTSRVFTLGCPKLTVITDHKPLLGIFNERDLGSIKNPRIRRLKEATLDYHFSIKYCPGKLHLGADALSRHPVSPSNKGAGTSMDEIAGICEDHMVAVIQSAMSYIDNVSEITGTEKFPQAVTLDKLELECLKDEQYMQLHDLVISGFPQQRANVPDHCKVYWPHAQKSLLSTYGGIILFKDRIVIPKSLHTMTLQILHSAHQGCTGMLARAGASVYWPGINKAIMSYQSNCKTCLETSPTQAREPMQLSPLPQRPFQNVCTDLFELGGHHYVIIVDRFSGFLHILHSKEPPTSRFLIKHLRDVFTRYGRPEQLETDGGPQYRSELFSKFLNTWGVEHRVSSPYYAQSNGRAEVAVKSAKRMLRDNVNPMNGTLDNNKVACAVLQYHNTPLQDGPMSPAQLLFGRALADFLPVNPKAYELHPYWIEEVEKKQLNRAAHHRNLAKRYNFGTRPLKPLQVGQTVAVQDLSHPSRRRWNRFGKVVKCLPFRKYEVKLHDTGNVTTRNRRFLKVTNSRCCRQNGRYTGPLTGPSVPARNTRAVSTQSPTVRGRSNIVEETVAQQPAKEPLAVRRLRPHNKPGLKE